MDQGNKLYRKCQRPRPYDLRRKVLLKNFLKEQMTFIPQASEMEFENEPTVDEENKAHYSNDVSSANSNETNDRGEFGVDMNSSFSMESPIEDTANPDLLKDLGSSGDKLPLVDHNTKETESKAAKFCSFMKLRSSRTKKTSGISKAKYNRHNLKNTVKEKPFIKAEISKKIKSFTKKEGNCNEEEVFLKPTDNLSELDSKSSKEHNTKNKSLAWRLFRPFRPRKRSREGKSKKKMKSFVQKVVNIADASINDEGSRTLINRSVQTDMTGDWDMDRLEQSNVLLKEENKLLVESISYFMNDTEIPTRKSFDNVFSDYQSHSSSSTKSAHNKTFEWLDYSNDMDSYPKSKRAKLEVEEVRAQKMYSKSSRISRSKSVQEKEDVKVKTKYSHRTQSMRVSSNKTSSNADRKASFYSQNLRMNAWHLNENSHISIPRVKSPSKRQNLSVSNSSRQIQRRSSMPERTHVKKHPKTCYRSGSFRDCHTSGHIPFHEMPAEAFY